MPRHSPAGKNRKSAPSPNVPQTQAGRGSRAFQEQQRAPKIKNALIPYLFTPRSPSGARFPGDEK